MKSIFIGGIALVVLAGCGFGGTATAAAAKTSPSPRAGRGAFGGGGVAGQVAQASSGKIVVTAQSGSVTVTYDASTSVLQSGSGSLADLAPGTCVTATGEKDASGAITATTVSAMLNMNGVCNNPLGGGPSPGAGPRAGASPRPGGFPSANPNAAFVRGKVAGASGSTITVQDASGATVTVNVPSTARITRLVTSSAARLAPGECVTATGPRSSDGTVQARSIVISAPGPNGCTTGGGGGRRGSPSPGQSS